MTDEISWAELQPKVQLNVAVVTLVHAYAGLLKNSHWQKYGDIPGNTEEIDGRVAPILRELREYVEHIGTIDDDFIEVEYNNIEFGHLARVAIALTSKIEVFIRDQIPQVTPKDWDEAFNHFRIAVRNVNIGILTWQHKRSQDNEPHMKAAFRALLMFLGVIGDAHKANTSDVISSELLKTETCNDITAFFNRYTAIH